MEKILPRRRYFNPTQLILIVKTVFPLKYIPYIFKEKTYFYPERSCRYLIFSVLLFFSRAGPGGFVPMNRFRGSNFRMGKGMSGMRAREGMTQVTWPSLTRRGGGVY